MRLLGLGLFALVACGSCPDLVRPALSIEIRDASGAATRVDETVFLDIDRADGASVHKNVDSAALPALPAGRYKLTFRVGTAAAGTLYDVCTAGRLTGCAAESAAADGAPLITLTTASPGATVALTRNGRCP